MAKKDNNIQNGIFTAPVELLNVKDINLAPYNPREISEQELDKLKESIKRFGYNQDILVNKTTMNVVGGNQRLTALIDLGIEKIQCKVVELTLDEEMALNVALNKISGTFNDEKLAEIFSQLQKNDFDLGFTGFDSFEIDEIISIMPSAEEFDLQEDEDDESEDNKEPEEPKEKTPAPIYGMVEFLSNEDLREFQAKFELGVSRTVKYEDLKNSFKE